MLPGGRREKDLPPLGLGSEEDVREDDRIVLSDEQASALGTILKGRMIFIISTA